LATETQVEEWIEEVGEPDLGDPVVQEWVMDMLEGHRNEEKRLKALFGLHHQLRNDQVMEETLTNLRKVRAAIPELEKMVIQKNN
jgi:hypothetical protein